MRVSAFIISTFCGVCFAGPSTAQDPMSAIDWLSNVTTTPIIIAPPTPKPLPKPRIKEAAVSDGISLETIQVTPLDAPSSESVGLLPASVSGLPANLWGPSTSARLARQLRQITSDDLVPATRELLFTLLLAELDPPFGTLGQDTFLLDRIKTLTRLGAVEPAHAMLERAGIETAQQFAVWFDLSVYLGVETEACELLIDKPGLNAPLPLRVFCLARTGDWSAATLSFGTGRALGQLTAEHEALLTRFLNSELDDTAQRLRAPRRPDPLTFQLYEAIGEPLTTTTLPVPFAHADLRDNTGWKAQVEAAERLTRIGALPANRLLGLYTERAPAASGGVWNRVQAVQTFDLALASSSPQAIATALPVAWSAMQSVGLERAFAELYGDRVRLFELPGKTGALAFRVTLLSEDYETAALSYDGTGQEEMFLAAIAKGDVSGVTPNDDFARAIFDAFNATEAPARFKADLDSGAIGSAALEALDLIGTGRRGDYAKLTDALALFRNLGLESVARRTALELLIMDPNG